MQRAYYINLERIFYRLVQPSYIITLFIVLSCVSCSDNKEDVSSKYRLMLQGRSSFSGNILFARHIISQEPDISALLGIYDANKQSASYFTSISNPLDFSWSPKEDMFIVTHGYRISYFKRYDLSQDYKGMAIPCPLDVLYTYCSWSPKGNWLAVNCYSLEASPEECSHKLGLYSINDRKFMMSDIAMGHQRPIWANDTTLYVPARNKVAEVNINSGVPELIQTIPLKEETVAFYGMFNEKPLIQTEENIQLGSKILVELDKARKRAVIATKKYFFISVPSPKIVVFDHDGNYLCDADSKERVRFGSIGNDPNAVYALAKNTLLRLCVKNNSLDVQIIGDLQANSNYSDICDLK